MPTSGSGSQEGMSHGAAGRYIAEMDGYTDGPETSTAWLERVRVQEEQAKAVQAADELLRWGIGDFTFIPGPPGLLGKGKFSTVYRVLDLEGKEFALKETALYPHHPLIATRLLREPELLGQIPPHPCLVGVEGFIKTPTHFYLVETLSKDHIPLSDMALPISRLMAKKLLDQLVSVVRDGLHNGGRVCHRDLKGENVLADPDGNIILLDLGLATHFSYSEPRLTTCCGSPAFHSPEIVEALAKPPGEVRYYGPELDIWCIALTLLSLLIQKRYPIGTVHKSVDVMAEACKVCLAELDALYPPDDLEGHEVEAWTACRKAMEDFLEIDGDKRMQAFESYDVGGEVKELVKEFRVAKSGKAFKTVTFIPMEIKYTLPLYMEPTALSIPEDGFPVITLSNPSGEAKRSIVSYIKYLLRSAGILYHTLPETPKADAHLQCVLTLPSDSLLIPHNVPSRSTSILDSIFGKRSSSVPASPRNGRGGPSSPSKRKTKTYCISFWLTIDCGKAEQSKARSREASRVRRTPSLKEPVNLFPQYVEGGKRPVIRKAHTSPRRLTEAAEFMKPAVLEFGEEKKDNSVVEMSVIETPPRTPAAGKRPVRPTAPRSRSSRPRVPLAQAGSTVTIRLSDARVVDIIRKALDQTKLEGSPSKQQPEVIDDEDAAIDRLRGRHRVGEVGSRRTKAQSTHPQERAGRGHEHSSLQTAITADVEEDQRLETGVGGASGLIDGITRLFSREPREGGVVREEEEQERPYKVDTTPIMKSGMLLI